MTRPCTNCPFRKDREPYLTKARVKNIVKELVQEQKSFPCHKTIDHTESGEGIVRNDSQHCAGALIMLDAIKKPNQLMRIAERLGLYNHELLDMDSPVFKDPTEFVQHHVDS